jgi:hypothetical protein
MLGWRRYPDPIIVVIAVGKPVEELVDADVFVKWSEVYAWFSKRLTRGSWAEHFVRYVEVFESKQLAEGYGINGTLTMFNGFHFSADNPYTYREGKRLIRLLGDELQRRKDLHDIGVDPEGKRRGAIKGKGAQRVWDFLPLVVAKDAALFTHFPHFTMSISHDAPTASITIPNKTGHGCECRKPCPGAEKNHRFDSGPRGYRSRERRLTRGPPRARSNPRLDRENVLARTSPRRPVEPVARASATGRP